jgi:hypothetical protein
MAADRQRLAAALAYEEERRRRMMESVPTTDNLPPVQPTRRSLRTDLENLSSGIGQGVVNQLEGVKALVTDPVGTAKAAYEGVKGVVRDPTVLADALRYTAQKATSGPLGAGEVIGEMIGPMRGKGPMAEIDVYHGSPHRFDEFDASKIGTGEGAQAYGHGIYLAEDPGVARSYRMTTTGKIHGIAGLPNQKKWQKDLIDDINTMMSREGINDPQVAITKRAEALDRIAAAFPDLKRSNQALAAKKAWLLSQRDKATYEKPGSFYTADLPDEMVDRMLDWDKPLSEQSPAVRETVMRYMNVGEKQLPPDMRVGQVGNKYVVLQDKPPLPGSTFGVGRSIVKGPRAASEQEAVTAYWNSLTGKDFYDTLGNDLGQNADASDYMRQLGIPGIKYLDAGSRGQGGSGTRNFVVFPGEEKKVKILKRE